MNIIKSSKINIDELDNKYYFKSLIDVAYRENIISETELNKLQVESIELLKKVIGMLSGNESFTVKYDRAKILLDSAYYTVGIYLKTCPTPNDAIKELLSSNLSEIFEKGNRLIENYITKFRIFYKVVKNNMLKLPNHTYFTSLKEIEDFFNSYNKDFEANLEIKMDYPLCSGEPYFLGIEYIMDYLTNLNYENTFMQKYDLKDIYNMLNRLSNISSDLVINVFKQVFITTIGEELSRHSEYHLSLSILEVEDIYMNLSPRNEEEIEYIIKSAINKIYEKMSINNKLKEYINYCLENIISNVITSIKNDKLDILFGVKPEYY